MFADIQELVEQKYINVNVHSKNDSYKLYNYSQFAQFEKVWNETTLNCRGYITYQGQVIARGPKKFFNYGEVEHPSLDEVIGVYEKADGSLGIPYNLEGTLQIATRGSFHSEQAFIGTSILYEYDDSLLDLIHQVMDSNYTPVFEIIYPENQIVVNYGDKRALVYIGSVNNESGLIDFESHRELFSQYCDVVKKYEIGSEIPENTEGFVVQFQNGECAKIKSEWYKNLHKLVANKDFYRMTLEGMIEDNMSWIEDVPDEFYKEIISVKKEIENKLQSDLSRLSGILAVIKEKHQVEKDIALEIKNFSEEMSFLFSLWRKGSNVTEKLLLKSYLNDYRKS